MILSIIMLMRMLIRIMHVKSDQGPLKIKRSRTAELLKLKMIMIMRMLMIIMTDKSEQRPLDLDQ